MLSRCLSSSRGAARGARALAVVALLLVSAGSGGTARSAETRTDVRTGPKLVVLISIDQMRADYIDQYGARWTKGLRRLYDQSAHFRNARYPYLHTVTCPGHTTIGTGTYPHTHGMILNGWYDREKKKLVECTDDPDSTDLGYGNKQFTSGDSAKKMMAPTLADEMKAQLSPKPRTISFSMKARSAIGLIGHTPDSVVWHEGGLWVTAKAFTPEPLGWLQKVIDANPREPALAASWDRVLPAEAYKFGDEAPEERPPSGWKRSFPHTLKYTPSQTPPAASDGRPYIPSPFSLWEKSPLADAYVGYLAKSAVDALKLGQGPSTDFLAVSFSVLDLVGHPFGPRSHEVQDVLVRLDATIGDLLDHLDKRVGAGKYTVALSADHGVAVLPEQLKAEGKDAGRVSSTDMKKRVSDALEAELGPGKHLAYYLYTDVYLEPGVYEKLKQKPGALGRVINAIRAAPGVAAVFTMDDLRNPDAAKDPVQRAAALSYYPGRNGDIVLAPKANWITTSMGTTHGSTNDYDQHVPVLLFGAGIKPGKYDRLVTPADIAPTLAQMVRVNMPKSEGKPLTEALAPAAEEKPAGASDAPPAGKKPPKGAKGKGKKS